MQSAQPKNKIGTGTILGIIFFLILFAAMFFRDFVFGYIAPPSDEISESKKASKDVAEALLKLDKINLDTRVLQTDYFQNIIVLPTFPTDSRTLTNFGKANPFLGNITIISDTSDNQAVGGIIFSGQRSVNNDESVVPVVGGQGQAPDGRR